VRALRWLEENEPKPGQPTLSPDFAELRTVSKNELSTLSACCLLTPAPLATWSSKSDLETVATATSGCHLWRVASAHVTRWQSPGQAFPLPRKGFRDDVQTKPLWDKAFLVLEDGIYDAICFDAAEADDGATVVSFTIAAGPHRGEVVELRSSNLAGDPVELLGIPATITVEDGRPRVRFEP
jgi:hypothetical protein